MHVINFKGDVAPSAVGASALEFFEQILSKLAGKQCAMLVFHAGYLRVRSF